MPLSVTQHGLEPLFAPTLAPLQETDFHQHARTAKPGPGFFEQTARRAKGAAGGEHIVDQKYARARRHGVAMDLQAIAAVFERVFDPMRRLCRIGTGL